MFGHGEASWERHHDLRRGFHLGLLILAIPAIIGVIRYYLHGGSTAGLIAAAPGAVGDVLLRLVAGIVGLIGLPMLVVFTGLIWLWRRRRR